MSPLLYPSFSSLTRCPTSSPLYPNDSSPLYPSVLSPFLLHSVLGSEGEMDGGGIWRGRSAEMMDWWRLREKVIWKEWMHPCASVWWCVPLLAVGSAKLSPLTYFHFFIHYCPPSFHWSSPLIQKCPLSSFSPLFSCFKLVSSILTRFSDHTPLFWH